MPDARHDWVKDDLGPRIELDADSREDLVRLFRFLELSERFDLFFLRFDAEVVLDFVTTALRGRYGERLVECRLPAQSADVDPLVALMQAVRGAALQRPIFLLRGLDGVMGPFGERTITLRILNERRDLLPIHVPGPLIIALRPQQLQQLREHAPDLWSIHTAVLSFQALPGAPPVRLADQRMPWLDDPASYDGRIESLAEVPGDEPTRLRAVLLGQRAAALAARGEMSAAEDEFAHALDAARAAADTSVECDLLTGRAYTRLNAGYLEGARADVRDAWPLARALATGEHQARLHRVHADLLLAHNQLDAALIEATHAGHVATRMERPRAAALASVQQGDILSRMGRMDEAEAKYAVAHAVLRALGDPVDVATVVLSQAHLARKRGDVERGLPLYDEALRLFRAAEHVPGVAATLGGRGLVSSLAGNRDGALADLGEARRLYGTFGSPLLQAQIALAEIPLLRQAGRLGEAALLIDQALALARHAGDLRIEGMLLREHGHDLMSAPEPRYAEGQEVLDQAVRVLAAAGATGEAASAMSDRGHALMLGGRTADAIACFGETASMAAAAGATHTQAFALWALADALSADEPMAAVESLEHAARLFASLDDARARAVRVRVLSRLAHYSVEHPGLAKAHDRASRVLAEYLAASRDAGNEGAVRDAEQLIARLDAGRKLE